MRSRPPPLLLTLVVAYGGLYLCRANLDAAFPILSRTFGYTKTDLGILSSVSIAVYAAGKVVLGTAGEVLGGRFLLLLAMWGSVAATLAFGASSTLPAFIVCACLNRACQSGGWSGAVNVVAYNFERAEHGRVMGVLSTSYEVGNVVAVALCAVVAEFGGWRPLFFVNALALAAAGLVVTRSLPQSRTAGAHPSRATPDGEPHPSPARGDATSAPRHPPAPPTTDANPAPTATLAAVVASLARQPAMWLTLALSVLLTFLRITFLTWTATYLADLARAHQDAAISSSIAKSTLFPAAGIVATLAIGAWSDRWGPGRRAPVMAASLALVVVLVLVLGHGGITSPTAAAVVIGGVGLFLLGPYSLLSGAIALDVSDKRGASTAAGLVDAAGYLGTSLAGVGLGHVVDTRGWSAAFDVVAGAALLATLMTAAWAADVMRRART
jgi:sugar phosphate permease